MSTASGPHDHHEPDDERDAAQAQPPYEEPRDQQPPRYEQPRYGQPQPDEPTYGRPQPDRPAYGQQPYSQQSDPLTGTVEMAPDQQRLWGMLAHLSPFVGALLSISTAGSVYLGAVGPLVIFLVLKDRGVFVRRQSAEALNFQILFTIVYLVGILLGVITFGIGLLLVVPLLIIVGIAVAVFQIIGAVKANQGIDYRYPLSWRLVK